MTTTSQREEEAKHEPSHPIEDTRVKGMKRLVTPLEVKQQLPITPEALRTLTEGRDIARKIIRGEDSRMLIVVGPCSIHDTKAAIEYAKKLAELRRQVEDKYFLMMRIYFEKPRTTIGWKGLINDPYLDNSRDIAHGLIVARRLLLEINSLGVPAATEVLDPIIPQYIADLISWSAIGARTTESQTHREIASGLSMPVGFKNGTDGGVQVAIDAMGSARRSHSFLGIDQEGHTSVIKTAGNKDSHVVLRGGRNGPNYSAKHIAEVVEALKEAGLRPGIMVDCNHANSGKDPDKQPIVWENILEQRKAGRTEIIGAMIESNLCAGSQPFNDDPSHLQYGISITDPCIDWERTKEMLLM